MAAAKKPRTPSPSPQTRQIEFTPGQMIIAICTLIVFGLVCFMLGVLVNRLDSTFAPAEAEVAQTEATTGEPDAALDEGPDTRARQTSPRPPETLQRDVAARNETTEPRSPQQPRTVAPPPATRRAETPSEPGQPAAPPPVEPTEPELAEPVEEPEAAAQEQPEPRVLENVEPMTPEEPEEPAGVEETSPAPAGGTAYGVQIASVSPEREEQARRVLTDAEETVNLEGRMVPAEDGTLLRLIIGSFDNRDDATRLMEEMRQHSQFEGCFVQTFTQPL